MTTHDNGCVETPDWRVEPHDPPEFLLDRMRLQQIEPPPNVILSDN